MTRRAVSRWTEWWVAVACRRAWGKQTRTSPRSWGSFGGVGKAASDSSGVGDESFSPCHGPWWVVEKAKTSVTVVSAAVLSVEGADGVVVAEG